MTPRLAKLADMLERVGWTALQAFLGALAATDITMGGIAWKTVLISSGIAAGVAAGKVMTAQNFSGNGLGDTLPAAVAPSPPPEPPASAEGI